MTSTEAEPVEHEDRWALDLRGPAVARIGVDAQLTLSLDAGRDVVLEAPARLSQGPLRSTPSRSRTPESQDVAAALPLFGAKVVSSAAFRSGTLRPVFDDGTHLTCPAAAPFEARQITGPRGRRFGSLPGGDLAVWSRSRPADDP